MDICDITAVAGLLEERNIHGVVNGIYDHGEEQRAEDVKQQIGGRYTLCLFVGADAAQKNGHALANVLADDDGNRRCKGDGARRGERLQDTDRGTGALDHRSDDKSCQNSDQGIFKRSKEGLEFLGFPQGQEYLLHGIHAVEQNTETGKDTGYFLDLFLF